MSSTSFRENDATFDGFGRLKSKHDSEQDENVSTEYTYLPDGKFETITDGRGAVKNYTYNNLGLATQIAWGVPNNSGIPLPATVSFSYDSLGNRTQIVDGLGNVNYVFDELSQLRSETREFNEYISQSPTNDNKFKIEYNYGLAGQLINYKEPFGELVSYGLDRSGRLKSVSGFRTIQNEQINYIDQIDYRARGTPKYVSYYGDIKMALSFNNRLQASQYEIGSSNTEGSLLHDYQYYADGRIKFSEVNEANVFGGSYQSVEMFDRSYSYDFLGRLTEAMTGAEASGQTENDPTKRPYRVVNTYNQFGDITEIERKHYRLEMNSNFTFDSKGRLTSDTRAKDLQNWFYTNETTLHAFDTEGRQIENTEKYDADGRKTKYNIGSVQTGQFKHWFEASYDGDGRVIKTNDRVWSSSSCNTITCDIKEFRINSSVLKEPIAEIQYDNQSYALIPTFVKKGRKVWTIVNGKRLATRQTGNIDTQYEGSSWSFESTDPAGTETLRFGMNGPTFRMIERVPLDPFNAGVGVENPYPAPEDAPDPQTPSGCDILDHDHQCEDEIEWEDTDSEAAETGSPQGNTCYIDGFEQPNCDQVQHYISVHDDTPVHESHGVETENSPFIGQSNDADPTTGDQDPGDAGEKDFEQQYTAAGDVSFGAAADVSITVSGSDISGSVSDLDLRNLSSPNPNPTPIPSPPQEISSKLNCIVNAVVGGQLGTNNIKENHIGGNHHNAGDGTAGHDGIHVNAPLDEKAAEVTALPAMSGTLKYVRSQGDGFYRLDILLEQQINNESYYLVLKDLNLRGIAGGGVGPKNLRIKSGMRLGSVEGADSSLMNPYLGETGLHVTLVQAKNYSSFVSNIQKGRASPIGWFVDAARDPLSPFICP